ncbi:hypothetical protein FHETE_7199 [Fusarium heterosporum]|uniref:Uncharacterized protein n=1 Tax=Fusarium heterosporum TaxID=42747 RepID=A0A8H5T6T9_FUSHE|nr:hypothetical protein FHETE_7199 [Fusarium heterosporum]
MASDEEEVWDNLPDGEQKSIWDETERNFWTNIRSKKEAENNKIEKEFQASFNGVRLKLSELTGQQSQLRESQSRLARELAKVEAELARTTDECEEKADRLARIEQDYHASRQKRRRVQHEIWIKMRSFFKEMRGEPLNASDTEGPESVGLVLPDELPELSSTSSELVPPRDTNGNQVSIPSHDGGDPMEGVEHNETLVNIVDADGKVIGPVEQVEAWNQWVEGIQELEIRRPVKIRRGRRFNDTHLSSIYERTEAKGVKWLACMIQATGEIQSKRCLSCDKNQGAFDDCIIVGGDLYQKCGNCEWNRQGCHGASGDTIDILASKERARRQKGGEQGIDETLVPASSDTVRQTVEAQPRPEPTPQPQPPQPQRIEEEISVQSRPHSPRPVPYRTLDQLPDRQPERQSEGPFERRHEQRPQGPIKQQPEGVKERQSEQVFERQPERAPDRVPEKFQEAISARVPERTVEVAPMRVVEDPHGMASRPIYEPTHGTPGHSTTVSRSDYSLERMMNPTNTTLPSPIQTQPRPQEPQRSALPSSAPRRSHHDILHPSTENDGYSKESRGSNTIHTPREPEQMPTPVEYRVTPGFTPANVRSRPPSSERGRPTPPSLPIGPSSQPPESPPAPLPVEEITRENMVLKNDGVVYTYPECVEGIPLVKITESHPYWEPNWPNVKTLIEPQLARWREKHQAAIDAGPKQEKGGSSKYQIGRQVNRGMKILEFHENGPISPYQLLSKKYIHSGKGGITSYDTLFRLSETMSELEKFNLDVSPVDWMRQRLHELIQAQGASFNLPRTIHDFYHDSKLTSLRYKHGFKNIGRPSGVMKARLSHVSPSSTPKPLQKRKSMHSVPTTPREDLFKESSPLPSQLSSALPTPAPVPQPAFSTHLNKKPKYLPPVAGPVHDEFHFDAWSDTDSCSGGGITKYDWRLSKVKTRLYTSHPNVTQYWTWIEQISCFQHQVLKDMRPLKWGLFRDEIDFHIYLEEIEEMVWNIEALRVHIIVKKGGGAESTSSERRGDVMASFPRPRTMRRFLFFCREKGVRMAKQSVEELDRRWESMVSEQLPGRGDSNKNLVE